MSLPTLDAFTVSARYGRDETTYDVRQPGGSAVVARLHKASQHDSRYPLTALTGPRLDEPAGYVNAFGAYGLDKSRTASVTSERRAFGVRRWRIDRPQLTGKSAGLSALRYRFPLSLVLTGGPANYVLPFTLRFSGPNSTGFTVVRRAGLRAGFTVTIHDPGLDRLVVLATVVALSTYESTDFRQEAVDATANPFKS